jgi:hypothetical protein
VLRRIFGPKRDGVTGGWRKLHNEGLSNLYSSPSVIRIIKSRRIKWAGHVARMGQKRNVYRLLVGKPEGKRPLRRPRHRLIDNIKLDLVKVGLGGVDWIGLAQDSDGQVEGSSENGNAPSSSMKFWEVPEKLHEWRPLQQSSTSWRYLASSDNVPQTKYTVKLYVIVHSFCFEGSNAL